MKGTIIDPAKILMINSTNNDKAKSGALTLMIRLIMLLG